MKGFVIQTLCGSFHLLPPPFTWDTYCHLSDMYFIIFGMIPCTCLRINVVFLCVLSLRDCICGVYCCQWKKPLKMEVSWIISSNYCKCTHRMMHPAMRSKIRKHSCFCIAPHMSCYKFFKEDVIIKKALPRRHQPVNILRTPDNFSRKLEEMVLAMLVYD